MGCGTIQGVNPSSGWSGGGGPAYALALMPESTAALAPYSYGAITSDTVIGSGNVTGIAWVPSTANAQVGVMCDMQNPCG